MITIRFGCERTTIVHDAADHDGPFSREYRTDREGNGLWLWHPYTADWRQIVGTGQISLRGARSTVRDRFRRALGLEC